MACRVVVADDAGFVRRMIKSIVTRAGHEVVAEAENGNEAVAYFRKHEPDAIIMDILMPELDGLQATKQIIAHDRQARIIVCSAVAEQTIVKKAIAAGACDYVVKPVSEERLLGALARVEEKNKPRMGDDDGDSNADG